ncbi:MULTISPECIES: energy-coupling factor ABC transporter ATP-binding protein [unclassified Nesterenkonia]|uniref:energy-coupling factor ABC transporter ATP-binding protein n=1 Tax=unclassified Nesterenkonia TaxID=2629769 RepID=UPI001F4C7D73|nr:MULTISPECIES: ABC transporter ATP-binding protein [unclassified Nesterenkonia]MCH8559247.1 energy-coupling factor ABC transporter ATP-binding protein [Nesterenkonia sp. DZ6]MCH8571592.1 energy-coupling factor ABC transporter ATP-binding protein [Nesterenkonia sp. AY15]
MTIEIDQLTVTATGPEGVTPLLRGVSACLEARTTAIIGENGSGKSTLAKVIGGLLSPASGTVTVNGLDVVRDAKRLRRDTGFIIANAAAQIIMPTVREDVALTLRSRSLNRRELEDQVDAALAEHGLTELADRSCLSLSSGQLQRLALCSVLVGKPDVVIADEPSSMLDARHQRLVSRRLFSQPADAQLVLVSHDLDLVRRCEETVWIHQGQVAGHGSSSAVVESYLNMLDETEAESTADFEGTTQMTPPKGRP